MNELTPTPRTDEELVAIKPNGEMFSSWCARGWDFARQLERELTEVINIRNMADAHHVKVANERDQLKAELEAMKFRTWSPVERDQWRAVATRLAKLPLVSLYENEEHKQAIAEFEKLKGTK